MIQARKHKYVLHARDLSFAETNNTHQFAKSDNILILNKLEVAAVFFTSYNRFFRTRENRSETPHSVTLTKYVAK
jgi:hypothetical protein